MTLRPDGDALGQLCAAVKRWEPDTESTELVLKIAAREYGKHSGPGSDERERAAFAADLRTAALRYARAYYAEARELGLIPEYYRKIDGAL